MECGQQQGDAGGAQAKANQAETNAKQYADGKIAEALNDSKNIPIRKSKV